MFFDLLHSFPSVLTNQSRRKMRLIFINEPDVHLIQFNNDLKPTTFNWNHRSNQQLASLSKICHILLLLFLKVEPSKMLARFYLGFYQNLGVYWVISSDWVLSIIIIIIIIIILIRISIKDGFFIIDVGFS